MLLHFLGRLFSKQWSVDVDEKNVESVSSRHCSSILFVDFEQVIVSWRSIALDCWGYLWFFEWIFIVFVFVSILIQFFTFLYFYVGVNIISSICIHQLLVLPVFANSNKWRGGGLTLCWPKLLLMCLMFHFCYKTNLFHKKKKICSKLVYNRSNGPKILPVLVYWR